MSESDTRLNIIKRDQVGNFIEFECPTCRGPVKLGPTSLTEIAAGYRVVSWCRGCQLNCLASLASLGGFLWSQD